jgi:hypothetical protein
MKGRPCCRPFSLRRLRAFPRFAYFTHVLLTWVNTPPVPDVDNSSAKYPQVRQCAKPRLNK